MGSAGEGVRKGCCWRREKQFVSTPKEEEHQTEVEGSSSSGRVSVRVVREGASKK